MKKKYGTAERLAFRAGVKWQIFRKYMIARANNTCEFCGQKYAREGSLNIHHKFDSDYENLAPSRFMVLCWTCHKFIHAKAHAPAFAARKLAHIKDYTKIPGVFAPGIFCLRSLYINSSS